MTSIVLEIPLDLLGRPGVGRALAELTMSLSALTGTSTDDLETPRPAAPAHVEPSPRAKSAPAGYGDFARARVETPAVEAPAPEPTPAPATPARKPRAPRAVATPVIEAAPAPRRATRAAAPAVEAARATNRRPSRPKKTDQAPAVLAAVPADERWRRFFTALPEPSRRFLTLLESKGKLGVAEAVQALGLNSPKAMGGLTGAMARWAPKQGVELPFDARIDDEGNRFWSWKGPTY